MAVLGRLLVSSAERLDLPDFLSIDSFAQGDFKYLMQSFVGSDKPYILKGFDVISPGSAIGTQNISIRVANSVVYYPGSLAGPFFHGLKEGNSQSAPLIPELRKNSTNYVYLTLTTSDAAKDTRAFWDPDKEGGTGGEFTQDVNTQTVLSVVVNVSASAFPDGVTPVCKVVVGANFIESIEDARDMMFRLGTGGLNPNPLERYNWKKEPSASYDRSEPNTLMSNALDPNPFQGGDKNINTLKEWMDAVMTKLAELGGTTHWYEDTSVYSIISVFKDALATSIKSKGYWNSSDSTAGLLTWSEDVTIQSTSDLSDVILRSGNKALADNEVLYINRIRDAAINTGSIAVEWFNGTNYTNGQLGSFENLSKGDWIKKADDSDNLYLRVEEFYAAASLGGGVTAPANALSVKLSANYIGLSESKQAVYSKGVYLNTEVDQAPREDAAIQSAAGNFYWLAMRSDTILNVSDITTTKLTIDITASDATKALVTSAAHGLSDGQRIEIVGSTNFDGSYAVSVETINTFYISLTGGPHADELAQSAFFATVTTAARSTNDGLQLESASHGLSTDQRVIVSDTSNYNGDYQVFPTGNTTFTMPVSSLIANEAAGTSTIVNIYVRADIGPTLIEQGQNKSIGQVNTDNILSVIGINNDAQTHPNYYITPNYNTLDAQENYNADATDNLTHRASKLTAMMADKTQDKTIKPTLIGVKQITNVSNVANQDITFIQKDSTTPMTLTLSQPSSPGNCILFFDSVVSLGVNQAAYISIDRNASSTLVSSSDVTVADISNVPLDENIFIVLHRLSDTGVNLWDGTPVNDFLNATGIAVAEVTTITPVVDVAGSLNNTYFQLFSASNETEYYVWFNVNAAGVDPAIVDATSIEIPIATNATADNIATAMQSIIDSFGDFSVVDNTGSITITNATVGATTNANDSGTTGFGFITDIEGVGEILHYVADGDLNRTAVKKLDESLYGGLTNVNGTIADLSGTVADLSVTVADTQAVVRQNNNMKLVAGGTWSWNIGAVNEVQSFVFSSVPTVGTWSLSDGSNTTSAIQFNASNATIKSAIESAFTTNSTVVNITGDYSTGIVVEIVSSTLGSNNYPQLTSSITGLDATITDSTVQTGIDPVNQLTWDADAYVRIPELADNRNTVSAQTIVIKDGQVAYVDVNRSTGTAAILPVTVANVEAITLTDNIVVIASRVANDIIVGTSSFSLADGERLQLDAALEEINRYFGQLRIIPHPTNAQRVFVTGTDVIKLDTTVISQAVKNLLLNFDGAQVDFQTGEILAADGFTPLGVDFTPTIPASGMWRWLSITLSPGSVNIDNTINGQLIVLSGASDGIDAATAVKPAFPNGTQLGVVAITSTDGSNVSPISAGNIRQLGVGGGSGGGTGDASTAQSRLEDVLDDSFYSYLDPNVFSIDEDNKIDTGISTASYSVADQVFNFATGEFIQSLSVLDPEFLAELNDVLKAQVALIFESGSEDPAPVVEVSNNGVDFQAVTMNRLGANNDTFVGEIAFDLTTLVAQTLHEVTGEDSQTTLTNLGTIDDSQDFTTSQYEVAEQLTVSITKTGSPTGYLKINLHEDNSGVPGIIKQQSLVNIEDLLPGQQNVTVNIGRNVLDNPVKYHIKVETDDAYKASYVATTSQIAVGQNSGASSMVFKVEGRAIDLLMKYTASAAAKLKGYGIYYGEEAQSVKRLKRRAAFVFDGTIDNLNEFQLPWDADPDFVEVQDRVNGQVWGIPSFSLVGNTVTFPVDFFNGRDAVYLIAKQVEAGSYDNNPENRKIIIENHLGSNDPALDYSVSGHGPIVSTENTAIKVEITVDENMNIVIKEA